MDGSRLAASATMPSAPPHLSPLACIIASHHDGPFNTALSPISPHLTSPHYITSPFDIEHLAYNHPWTDAHDTRAPEFEMDTGHPRVLEKRKDRHGNARSEGREGSPGNTHTHTHAHTRRKQVLRKERDGDANANMNTNTTLRAPSGRREWERCVPRGLCAPHSVVGGGSGDL